MLSDFYLMKRIVFGIIFLIIGCTVEKDRQIVDTRKKMIFFGDSLTAGLGVMPVEAYPALIQQKINLDKKDFQVINAGVSGDTTTTALERIDWILTGGVDVFVLELGANDGMKRESPSLILENLHKIIQKVREKNKNARIFLVEMRAFPNMGKKYSKQFNKIYPEITQRDKIIMIPFFLEGIAGVKRLNQKDGIHPTAEGHVIMANKVYLVLKEYL